jgi:hypothetical protein
MVCAPLALQGNLKQVVRPLEENRELFGAVDLRGAELDFQAERDCLQRLQEPQDPGRADFSLSSPLYLNLFPVSTCDCCLYNACCRSDELSGAPSLLYVVIVLYYGIQQSMMAVRFACTCRHFRARRRPTQASAPSHRPPALHPGSRRSRQQRRAAAVVRGACAASE